MEPVRLTGYIVKRGCLGRHGFEHETGFVWRDLALFISSRGIRLEIGAAGANWSSLQMAEETRKSVKEDGFSIVSVIVNGMKRTKPKL